MTTLLVLVTVAAMATGCGRTPDPALAAAEGRAASLAADASEQATTSPTAAPPTTSTRPAPPPPASADPAQVDLREWDTYPWPPNNDGKACTRPQAPRPYDIEPSHLVVVVGDSLIRNGMPELEQALRNKGFRAVFVCWGGKTTRWGIEQADTMREMGLLPRCLVVNLGTNDVKNEAASADELRRRLAVLLRATRDIPHVLLVDLWANTAIAPSTMAGIADTVTSYPMAAADAGTGTVITWSDQARSRPDLVGPDGVHDSAAGEQVRAELVADAVSSSCG